jgi:putative glutamine amidotransferase
MAKPWIGIPTRFRDSGEPAAGEPIDAIRRYVDAVLWAGGLPVMIPTFAPLSAVQGYRDRLDGILLPGSPTDINPALFGEEPHPKLGKLFPERDALDFYLLEYGEQAHLPVLGICFGAQSLNVFRGGKLIQDIPSVVPEAAHHDDHGEPEQPARHRVHLNKGSLLARLAGSDAVDVNSFHHQAISMPGKNLQVVATAPDGVIEAVEDTTGRFFIGVQWHPERNFQDDAFSQALFTAFVEQAGGGFAPRSGAGTLAGG